MIPLNRIKEIAAARGDQIAICGPGSSLTWNKFARQTGQLVNGICRSFKTDTFSTIAFVCDNRPELVLFGAAMSTIKITFCGIDYSLDVNTIAETLDKINADCVVISSDFLLQQGIEAKTICRGRIAIDLDNSLAGAVPFQSLFIDDPDRVETPKIGVTRAISFTSGTSGPPKVVVRTASFDVRRFAYFTARYGFSAHDRHLVTIPLYHAAGSGWARLFLQLGSRIVIAPTDLSADEMISLIETQMITTTVMTPPTLECLVRQMSINERRERPLALRFVLIGGKHFPAALKTEALNVLGSVVYEYYGTTETGVNTIAEPEDLMMHPESVGRRYDGNQIVIVGDDSKPLEQGKVGRVAIGSYMNMDRYLDRDVKPNEIELDGISHLITPELGYLDACERLFLMNRSDGANSLNLYAMENMLRRLPFVEDVSLIPGKRSKSVVCGFTTPLSATQSDDDIISEIRRCLGQSRIRLERVAHLPQIPYSPSGKVRAPALSDAIDTRLLATVPNGAMPIKRILLGIGLVTGTALAWGAMFPIAKAALTSMDAFYLTLFRYGLASLILLAVLIAREGFGALRTEGKTGHIFLYGSLGFAGFSILAFLGLSYTKPEHGAIIMALMPLITALIQWIRAGVMPSVVTFLCIIIALFGVLLVVSKGSLAVLAGGALWPSLVILSGASCWVLYTLSAAQVPQFSTLRYTALSASFGAITIAAVTLLATLVGFVTPPPATLVISLWPEISYLVLIAGVAAVFSWNIGIKTLGPINGVLFINLVPLTTLFIGWFNGHSFNGFEYAGVATVIGALLLNNLAARGLFSKLHLFQGRRRRSTYMMPAE